MKNLVIILSIQDQVLINLLNLKSPFEEREDTPQVIKNHKIEPQNLNK